LSVDPLFESYPFYTPYQFAGNSPILFIDIDGLERGKRKIHREKPSIKVDKSIDIYNVIHKYKKRKEKFNTEDKTGWGYYEEYRNKDGDKIKDNEVPKESTGTIEDESPKSSSEEYETISGGKVLINFDLSVAADNVVDGLNMPESYDRIDIYAPESIREDIIDNLSEVDGFDPTKVHWLDAPEYSDESTVEIHFRKEKIIESSVTE
jgi:hypothetical protein